MDEINLSQIGRFLLTKGGSTGVFEGHPLTSAATRSGHGGLGRREKTNNYSWFMDALIVRTCQDLSVVLGRRSPQTATML